MTQQQMVQEHLDAGERNPRQAEITKRSIARHALAGRAAFAYDIDHQRDVQMGRALIDSIPLRVVK